MGLLDDAIREHLDLKRRRGADPAEIERLEREALGPVRRPPHDAADSLPLDDRDQVGAHPDFAEAGDWEEPAGRDAPFDHAAEFDVAPPGLEALPENDHRSVDQLGPEVPVADEPASASEPEYGQSTATPDRDYGAPRHHEIAEEWETHERSTYAEPGPVEPATPAPVSPPRAPAVPPLGEERLPPGREDEFDQFDQETVEYDVESEEGQAPEGEDVLEETPDFLQDAPDHDRLWFEQRPPRDFDIDG